MCIFNQGGCTLYSFKFCKLTSVLLAGKFPGPYTKYSRSFSRLQVNLATFKYFASLEFKHSTLVANVAQAT